ncbi:hypothetical protein F442_05665 [Phytophthora nicotianae P10297]|uniref:Glycoside hydrolase 131 catalytic N-terminal domain-containing protein n=5 Tax=Phytophthora nicotianae TaxID=4792 RepID=W2QDT7_PHYN3|nr:hypothetical protein PPTG_10229 [Phytophthora nicotianae INRA-310]ETI50942.1 hypothetical protein F443_05621 [Phytophthora nicotianae P1569]ETM50562.1 hypothetical protein L914_05435 [Phytophthora nicotianae]ETN11312.1 hypothetical protein PPTG_10229 [Phytophthora nicotianae INRA-310]ETP48652.1 hypothetical protein F442_05665 [Phytophthora nicotianae P10297]
MARIHSILTTGMVLLATLLSSVVHAADDQALPWDGTFQDLAVDTLTDKYLTHILTNRQNGTVSPDQWVTITQKGRSPAFNGDTGVATLAVDSEAIFGGQTNFRRSELVQDVAGNTAGTTFFRVSLMKEEAYVNLYSWQVVFPESHLFEIRIDASVDPVLLVWYTGGSTETRWSTEFKTETWYNFGIAVSSGELALYFSEGDDALALTKTETYNGAVPTDYEFHFGQLTLSNDGSAVKMADKQDILSFNGVTVENGIPSDLGSTSSVAGSSTGSESTSTSANTPAPVATTATPTVTTAAPSTETSEDDAASEAEASEADASEVEETTEAPTVTTAVPATEAPSTDQNSDTDAPATNDTPTTSTSGCKARRY